MVQIKTTAVTDLKNSDCCDAIQDTINEMTGQPLFPTPSPSLTDMQTSVDTLRSLEIQSRNRERSLVAQKRTARETLNALFLQLCLYIVFTLRTNPDAEDIIISLGLVPAQKRGQRVPSFDAPANIRSVVSQEPGCIDLDWHVANPRGIHGYVVEIAEGNITPSTEWRMLASCTTTRFRVSGLNRGSFYSFRTRSVGAGSVYSDPSEVTTCVAG